MVFPSVPIYLDHHTWLQQHGGDPHVINNPPIVPTLPPTLPPIDGIVGTRPSSMPEHGRIAKVPYGETPLKCPRCESTNTKFCYFNNYSLSQPRHFCKTCRRYWTRGGALRDVPVGGGCRRSSSNKSKGNQSKSPITLQSNPTSTTPIPPNNLLTNNKFIANSNLPIFPSMPNVLELANAGGNNELGFQIGKGTTSASAGTLDLSAASGDQWTSSSSHQLNSNQLSCFSGGFLFEQPVGAYNFNPLAYDQVGERSSALEVGFAQLSSSSMKHEENQGLSMARNLQRYSGNDQYWSTGNTWRDISGSSSSASHFT